MERDAYISPCQKYRYWLYRSWDKTKKSCSFIMLNPSTADADIDDPTIRRCIAYAQKFGFGSFYVINLFAYRTPYKNVLKKVEDPVGPENDVCIESIAKKAEILIAAWGNDGAYMHRSRDVLAKLLKNTGKIYYLQLSKLKEPCHPLYLRKDLSLVPM